jgi:hypothetical protein
MRKINKSSSNICPEPVFVNQLRSPGIKSQPGGPVLQPYLLYIGWRNRFPFLKQASEPVLVNVYVAQESIPPVYVARARICRSFKETRYRFSAWRVGTKPYLSYWPARLHRLAKSIPQNRFLCSINVYKYGLWRAVQQVGLSYQPARLGIDSMAP